MKSGYCPGWGSLSQYRHEVRQLLGDQVLELGGSQRLLPTLHRILVEILDQGLNGLFHITEFLGILRTRDIAHVREASPTLSQPASQEPDRPTQ